MSPRAVDTTCLLIAAILPIPLILRWDRLGVALGTMVVWGSLIVAGMLLSRLDPHREAGILDGVWILFGWIGGLMYCAPIYLLKCLGVRLRRGKPHRPGAGDL